MPNVFVVSFCYKLACSLYVSSSTFGYDEIDSSLPAAEAKALGEPFLIALMLLSFLVTRLEYLSFG